ncbi:MAG TPA: CrcB family protein [Allosphingosinicella sp.]|jgi:CrcB protein
MPNLLLVLLGGAAGAGLRYEAGRLALRQLGPGFPWGTLAVNLAGGLAMGVLAGAMAGEGMTSRPAWLLLGVGLLGGFTTFSAFSLDLFLMLERGQAALAFGYALASALGALALLALGYWAARALA